jgi:hypothetical protein
LVSIFENLCRDLALIAEKSGINLSEHETFSLTITDWQSSLMQLYENLYTADCLKVKKNSKAYLTNKRGVPENMVCYSRALDPIIDFLHDRKVRLC